MPFTAHVATIAAYEVKTGGFRGVFKKIGEERIASDVFETLEEAKFWAKTKAHEVYAPSYSLAPLRLKGEYRANVWVQV